MMRVANTVFSAVHFLHLQRQWRQSRTSSGKPLCFLEDLPLDFSKLELKGRGLTRVRYHS